MEFHENRGFMQVCFIGHRHIDKTETLTRDLKEILVSLIKKGYTSFAFGSMSDFDDLAWEIITELKKEYANIKRIYVRSRYQYLNNFHKELLSKYYEETYFPKKLLNAGKYTYVERNFEMINNSTICIFYYNKDYAPPLKQQTTKNSLSPKRRKSGTKIAYEYAVKKNKQIINLFQ